MYGVWFGNTSASACKQSGWVLPHIHHTHLVSSLHCQLSLTLVHFHSTHFPLRKPPPNTRRSPVPKPHSSSLPSPCPHVLRWFSTSWLFASPLLLQHWLHDNHLLSRTWNAQCSLIGILLKIVLQIQISVHSGAWVNVIFEWRLARICDVDFYIFCCLRHWINWCNVCAFKYCYQLCINAALLMMEL